MCSEDEFNADNMSAASPRPWLADHAGRIFGSNCESLAMIRWLCKLSRLAFLLSVMRQFAFALPGMRWGDSATPSRVVQHPFARRRRSSFSGKPEERSQRHNRMDPSTFFSHSYRNSKDKKRRHQRLRRDDFARTTTRLRCSTTNETADDSFSSSTGSSKGATNKRRLVSFLTDVEGDREYLTRYVNQSRVLAFRDTDPIVLLQSDGTGRGESPSMYFPYNHCIDFSPDCLESGAVVFGGDVWDQGGSDLYVIRQLLHFQRRYPDRVHLILGNRDINKMRLLAELGPPGDPEAPPHAGVFHVRSGSSPGPPSSDSSSPLATHQIEPLSRDPVQRLQWILAKTMGSPRAFEHRRWELTQERETLGQFDAVVTDEDVVESYRISCHPRLGEMGQYLSRAKLVLRLGEALFLHGSLPLTDELISRSLEKGDDPVVPFWTDLTPLMPWLEDGTVALDVGVGAISDWFHALNDFAQQNVENWKEHNGRATTEFWSSTGGYHHEAQPYSALLQYGMGWLPGGVRNPTIVYSSWCTDGMPRRFFPDAGPADRAFVSRTQDFFERTGIRLLCSGHQPQGDAPNVIRLSLDGNVPAYIVSGDTSYSGDTEWHNLPSDLHTRRNRGRGDGHSGRGLHAVSEILIEQCAQTGELWNVTFHGTLSDGTKYEAEPLILAPETATNSADHRSAVGRPTPEPIAPPINQSPHKGLWWTRAVLADGSLLISSGEGFRTWNRLVNPNDR